MALLSVDKKVRYPDDQLEKPQRMQKSIAPPVRAPDFHRSNNQFSPVEESRRWKKPSVEFHQDGTRRQYYCPQGGEVVAQVPNCLAFSPRLAQPRLGRGNHKTRNLGIVVLCTALAGCASSSSDITPAYVSPVMYQAYTCPQLAQEAQAVSTRAASLSGVQDQKRTNDGLATAAAVVIFWPATFFVGGDKQAALPFRLRGAS